MANPRITFEADASAVERAVGIAKGKFGELESALPAKGMAAFSSAAAAVGATLSAGGFIAGIKKAIDSLDALEEAAQSAGVSVESLQALRYAATFAGVGSEQLQKSLEVLSTKLAEAAAGGKEAQETFRAMGVNFRNSSGQLLQTDEALAKIADKFASYHDGAEKTALAADIFGQKIGPKLIPFLNQGAAGLEKLRAEAEKLGLVFSGQAIKAASDFNDQLDRLKLQAEAAAKSIALDIIPFLTKTIQEFNAARDAAGSFGGALLLLAKQSAQTLEDPGEKIQSIRQKIGGLRDDLENYNKSRITFGSKNDIKNEITDLERELKLLLAIQQNRALAASAGQDFSDAQSRRIAARGNAAPIVPRGVQEKLGNYGPEFEDLKRIRANRAKMAEEIEEEDRKTADRNAELAQRYVEQWTRSIQSRVDAARAGFMTETELEQARYTSAFDALSQARDAGLVLEEQYRTDVERLEADHQLRLNDISDRELMRRYQVSRIYRKLDIDSASFALGQISQLMNTHSRKQFEIGKAAAVVHALVDTYRAAMGTWAALSEANPYVAAAAAAAVTAAGLANVARIANTKFGDNGSGLSFAGAQLPSDASGGANAPNNGVAAAQRQGINLTLVGDGFSREQIRQLIEGINEAQEDGVEIRVTNA